MAQSNLNSTVTEPSPSRPAARSISVHATTTTLTPGIPDIVKALAAMPDETVIDGEVVALDAEGRPSFNTLQNYGSAGAPLHFFIFDLLILKGKDVMGEPLVKRRELIEEHVLPKLADPIRYSPILEGSLKDLMRSVKAQGLEGLVAKRRDSGYEPGLRSGAWMKMRVNAGQELVIGGYTPSPKNFDALVIGYYDGSNLIYAARTRNGFTPTSRAESCSRRLSRWKSRIARSRICRRRKPDAGALDSRRPRWAECRWLKPVLVAQFEFVEWTSDQHLRHSRFMALRDDKKAKDVRRE